jgi:hypothetical protein
LQRHVDQHVALYDDMMRRPVSFQSELFLQGREA